MLSTIYLCIWYSEAHEFILVKVNTDLGEDGGEIGGSRVHFPSAPVKHLADLRNTVQHI